MIIDCISEYEEVIKHYNYSSSPNHFIFSDSIEKFKITKHRDGNYPAIVTISGFLSEDFDNRLNWQNSILNAFPDSEWFHLEWNTQKFPFKKKKYSNKVTVYVPKSSNPKWNWIKTATIFAFTYTRTAHLLLNNWWHLTVRNSKHTGKLLGDTIMACKHKEFILVGHSLGARVIHNCLEHISNQDFETNIKEVHLLGGAVNSRKLKWEKTVNTVNDKIYNYYSKNDWVLKFLYGPFMIDRYPIGLQKIDLPYFENIDSSKFISGHKEYIPNFHIIKVKKK